MVLFKFLKHSCKSFISTSEIAQEDTVKKLKRKFEKKRVSLCPKVKKHIIIIIIIINNHKLTVVKVISVRVSTDN